MYHDRMEKELLANNLLCLENVYEFNDYDQSLYSAVMMGKTVCAGFSKSFCAMMNALDVDTTAGLSYNKAENMGHAWNVVRFDDGNCYCVDVCWNDYDGSKRGYQNDYFNVGEADSKNSDFAKIYHTYMADYEKMIPAIATASYSPTPYDTDTKKSDEPAQPPEPTPSAQPKPTQPGGQLVELVKTGPTAPDVTVDKVRAYDIHVSGCSSNSYLYLFPDDSYREEEKTNRRTAGGKSGTYFTITPPEWESKPEPSKLEAPKNVKVTAEPGSITVKFDPVEGLDSDHY